MYCLCFALGFFLYDFVVFVFYLQTMLSLAHAISRRMIRRLMDNEVERLWNEAVVAIENHNLEVRSCRIAILLNPPPKQSHHNAKVF
jgi:hypothetical protein